MNDELARKHGGSTPLHWIGAIAIAAIAVMRCVVVFQEQIEFATDPVLDPSPVSGLGPVGSLVLDALLLIGCALALFGEAARGRGIDWRLYLLALLPAPVIFWQGAGEFGDLGRGMTWLSALVAAVTVAHLVREHTMRIMFTCVLAAVAAPLVMRGIVQVVAEHPRDLDFFRAHRAEVLAAQHIAPDSNSALIFERRLDQAEATGWFGLANVFGSFMVFGMIAWLGMTIAAVRAKLPSGWWGVTGLMTIGCLAGTWLSGSKGAAAAALLGLMLLAGPFLLRRLRDGFRRFGGAIALGAVALAILAVVFRGIVLPEGFAGDKSILFRWHYLLGTLRIIGEHALTGVGPEGFQEAYVKAREPVSPEEIKSAHSIFFDWLAMLGVVGAAWIALAGAMLWRAGRWLGRSGAGDTTNMGPAARPTLIAIVAALVAGLVPGILLESATLDPAAVFLRAVAIVASLAAALVAARIMLRSDHPLIGWGIAAASIALMAHAQIEMTLMQPGAVVWGLCALGVAAGARDRGSKRLAVGCATLLIAGSVALAVGAIAPAWRQQSVMSEAAAPLREIGTARLAGDDEPTSPGERREQEWALRNRAAGILIDGYDIMPRNPDPLLAAIEQLGIAAALDDNFDPLDELRDAAALAQRLLADHPGARSQAAAARVWEAIAAKTGDPADWDRAIAHRRALADGDPHGVYSHLTLADLLWQAGQRDEAREVYQRVLTLNENWYLDELKQLGESEIRRIEGRLAP